MKKMKVANFKGKEVIEIEERDIPKCDDGGILIKVESCGICGGDIRNFYQGLRHGIESQVMGHEVGGIVVDVGEKVKKFSNGDRVAIAPDVSCGECYYCKRGLVNLCDNHRMLGTHWPGGFAQYIYLPEEVIERGFVELIPDTMTYDQAAMAEPASSVIACQEYNNVKIGDTVVIIGDGPIGCLHIEVAKARGAEKVIMVGLDKLHLAEQFNPDHLIDASKVDPVIEVKKITNELGADIVICANPVTKTQQQGIEMVKKRGKVILFGGVPKSNPMTSLDSNLIHYNEITVVGAFSYSSIGLEDAVKLINNKVISADKYITKKVKLDEVVEAIKYAKEGKALKIIIKPWDN